ncbi:MAG: alpha/beta fold hydrolase [Sandaracinus sp.]|nr:alpha/beta fold hydrolase [Sandaracinus sp.]MCB9615535.1 alpha/beta fold hydrolase [Sandaracinus sp.]
MQVSVQRGVVLEVERLGPTKGVPLVVVHGYTGGLHEWRPLAERWSATRPVVLFHLRGHGRSTGCERVEDYAMPTLARDLVALLDALDLDRVDVLGHSLGGMIALRFAVDFPERLRALVLVATSARRRELDPPRPAWRRLLSHARRRMGLARKPLPRPAHVHPVALHAMLRAIADQPETVHDLASLHAPSLVIVGQRDSAFLRSCEELAERLPDVAFAKLHGVGHTPMLEVPDVVTHLVDAHLREVDGATPR